jgi:ABC-type spermidine/putrescine transport system permease subunit II
MFQSLRDQIDPTIAAISSLLIILSAVVLASVAVMSSGKKQRSEA